MANPADKLRVCFVAHNAFGFLANVDVRHAGGIERQQVLIARSLAARGHDVSLITWDHGQEDGAEFDGVTVRKMCARDAGRRVVRFVHPRWTSLCAAMKRADAQVYCYSCGDLGLGQIVSWCRWSGRASLFSVASDPDCDARLPVLKEWRERTLYRYGLRNVDRIVVQTHKQQRTISEGWGLRATHIPMPSPGLPGNENLTAPRRLADPPRVLWVGRFSHEKRLEWLLDIAERCPKLHFDVVGGANHKSDYADELIRRASSLSNVHAHGRVGDDVLARLYRDAHVLCCTSEYEGFPNTFLEAWSVGVPLVTTHDPDGVVASERIGAVGDSVDALASALKNLTSTPAAYADASRRAQLHYRTRHTVEAVLPMIEQVLRETVQRPAGAARQPTPSRGIERSAATP